MPEYDELLETLKKVLEDAKEIKEAAEDINDSYCRRLEDVVDYLESAINIME